jgi:hypothetical protein
MITDYDLFINSTGFHISDNRSVSLGDSMVATLHSNAMVTIVSTVLTEYMMEEMKVQRQNRPFVLAFTIYFSNVASYWAIKNHMVLQLY